MAMRGCASWPGILAMILLAVAGCLLVASLVLPRFTVNASDESCINSPDPQGTCISMFLRDYYFRPGALKPGESERYVKGPQGSKCAYQMAVTLCPRSLNGTILINCYCPSQYTDMSSSNSMGLAASILGSAGVFVHFFAFFVAILYNSACCTGKAFLNTMVTMAVFGTAFGVVEVVLSILMKSQMEEIVGGGISLGLVAPGFLTNCIASAIDLILLVTLFAYLAKGGRERVFCCGGPGVGSKSNKYISLEMPSNIQAPMIELEGEDPKSSELTTYSLS